MTNQIKGRLKKVKNLIFVSTLSAVILGVTTFAWFIGMRSVNLSTFDIDIAVADSLQLCFDGKSWSDTVSISKDTLNNVSYEGHTNRWGGHGLIPMSTVGEMDDTASRMKLYEKAGYTASPGGYRFYASRVDNYNTGQTEQDGYVVFDLFIKNFTGTQYIEEENELDEEAIYLTIDSAATVASTGVANTGIENSVRVAFAQIGRVSGFTTEQDAITSITCADETFDPDGKKINITGLCRTAQIWEPNDRDHVKAAISYYNTSCLKRTGSDTTKEDSYENEACGQVIDGMAYATYAVKQAFGSDANVDVYDGPAYNGYAGSTSQLDPYSYFTDTKKLLTGTKRPEFMTLAPNSITKVRVYVFIEGQDIDNYNFSAIGKRIAINFGFTKERFTEDDIGYQGPNINQGGGPGSEEDRTPPVITLTVPDGEEIADPMYVDLNTEFVDPGATAYDKTGTDDNGNPITVDLTDDIEESGTVDITVPGNYLRVYSVADAAGNLAVKTRTVTVVDPSAPSGE